jgi:hypothetical protein
MGEKLRITEGHVKSPGENRDFDMEIKIYNFGYDAYPDYERAFNIFKDSVFIAQEKLDHRMNLERRLGIRQ